MFLVSFYKNRTSQKESVPRNKENFGENDKTFE